MSAVGSVVDQDDLGRGISAEIARDWETWSRTLGILALPHLQQIHDEVETLTAAMLCTGDGLNIATIGVPEAGINRLAALSSSLFGVAGAHREVVDPGPADDSTMVSIAGGSTQTVILRFEVAVVGPLLIVVTAQDVTLGVLIVAARNAARSIRGSLEPGG